MTIEIKNYSYKWSKEKYSGAKKSIVDKESIISLKYLRDGVVKCYDISNIAAMKLSYLEGEEWYHLEKTRKFNKLLKNISIYMYGINVFPQHYVMGATFKFARAH